MAISTVRPRSQPLPASIFSCSSACSAISLSMSASGSEKAFDTSSKRASIAGHLAGALHDVAQHVLRGVELRLLLQEADLDALGRPGLAGEIVVLARP